MRFELRTWIVCISAFLWIVACGGDDEGSSEESSVAAGAGGSRASSRAGSSAAGGVGGASGSGGEAGRMRPAVPRGDLAMAVAMLTPIREPEPAPQAGADGAAGSQAGSGGAAAGAGGDSAAVAGAGGSSGAGGASGAGATAGAGAAGSSGRDGSAGRSGRGSNSDDRDDGGRGGSGGRSGSGGTMAMAGAGGAAGMAAAAGGGGAAGGGAAGGGAAGGGAAGGGAAGGGAGSRAIPGVMGTATFTNLGPTVELSVAVTACTSGKNYPIHIHEGSDCADAMTQGAHWDPPRGEGIPDVPCMNAIGTFVYNREIGDAKPWSVGAPAESNVVGHVVVIHDPDDPMKRIACGKIEARPR